MNAPARVGWCPGALRPMASGDGLILRVKPRCARLDLTQARAIADVTRRFGNGALDLTSHANVQIRGIGPAGLDAAIAVLDAAGLIDPHPEAEAVRNLVVSPLAGLDPSAVLDIRPLVAALERRLVEDDTLHRLPAKFSILIDDGGALGLDEVAADIRFKAVRRGGTALFAVGLGGDDTEALSEAVELTETVAALALRFITAQIADPELQRMRDLVRCDGAAAILYGIVRAPALPSPFAGDGGLADRIRGNATAVGPVASGVLGVAAPFGRLDADQFEAIIDVAADAGAAELRITPWRSVLVPGLSSDAASIAAARCRAKDLIVDAMDPRLAVAACPGAPGCHRGSTAVMDDAAHLAERLNALMPKSGVVLHVSGCAKGCAHAGPAPFTLVGREGRYDIVIGGRASDAPALRDLTIEAAARWLEAASIGERGV